MRSNTTARKLWTRLLIFLVTYGWLVALGVAVAWPSGGGNGGGG